MSRLKFRNLRVTPEDPVETWGYEGLLTAIDRGGIEDWAKIAKAVLAEPYGSVATTLVDEVLDAAEDSGAAEALRGVVDRARRRRADDERQVVAGEVRALITGSGLSRAEFAQRIGTSTSRLSTYATGRVTPSATMLLRMRRLCAPGDAVR